ncbi:hypothetical protein HPB52_003961 [Rhipicephalus sanguineus]|uniref:Uncharacterized protein n=1 Tax=Rhipicephalus sanguineus TaxID=34632 RepID=A0A9D4SMY9_RHISA|nr:hypothetical protein HPB52_003961 [Rhipicephalus sanguineus]
MASLERLFKNRGVFTASVTRTIMLLTDEIQATAPDAAQVDSHVTYLTQKNVELGSLNKQILDATDDDAYDEELEAAEDYDRKVSYAVPRARFFLREHANTATATRISRPEATLSNADVAGAGSSAHNEVPSVRCDNFVEAEEAAIALAFALGYRRRRSLTVLTVSEAACRNYLEGRISQPALNFILSATYTGEHPDTHTHPGFGIR